MRRLLSTACVVCLALRVPTTLAEEAKPPAAAAADFVPAGAPDPLPAPVASVVDGVMAPALGVHVAFLASPALEGRGLGTPGLEAAAEYAAAHLALAGIAPLGRGAAPKPGSAIRSTAPYFDTVPIREITRPTTDLEVERPARDGRLRRPFSSGVDCIPSPAPPGTLVAPVVYAGYGIREKSPARDDYRGLDVAGKIVLLRGGLPDGKEWRTPELVARYAASKADERYEARVETARQLGAAAVLAFEEGDWAGTLAKETPEETAFAPLVESPSDAAPLLVRVSPAVAGFLLGADPGGTAALERPRSLAGVTATLRSGGRDRAIASRNVVGVIPGSDPRLADEAVILGAHLDHLGRVGGKIHPGADDNASGVAALIEIARSFAHSPVRPKRTLVFAFWTGEEEGKLGSGHWLLRPLWPVSRTTAYVNLDMIGHPWTAEEIAKLVSDSGVGKSADFLSLRTPADFVEPGVADFAPFLGPVLVRAARGLGLALHLDWTGGTAGGSDYRAFARARVPFVRFFGNFFPGYHRPADTAEALDPEQVQRVARVAAATAWLLADR